MEKKFENQFKLISKSMYLSGIHPNAKKDIKWILTITFLYLVAGVCGLFLVNSIVSHDIKNEDYAEAIKNGIMAILGLAVLSRHAILVINRESVKELIEMMDRSIIDAENYPPDEKEIVAKYLKMKIRFAKFWTICLLCTGFMFPLKSCILMIYYTLVNDFKLVLLFDMTYPSIINKYKYEPFGFAVLYLLTTIFDIFSLCVYLSFDVLVPIILLHLSSELQILRIRINKAFADISDPENIQKQLKDINIKLQAIYRYVSLTRSVFSSLFEIIMKAAVIMAPFAAFEAQQALRKNNISAEFSLFFVSALLDFFIPCYYSDHLLETSELLRKEIWSCGWEMQSNIKIRKTILFMLTRTMTPLVLRTIFVPICLDTFSEICRQSYAIYNLLNVVTE